MVSSYYEMVKEFHLQFGLDYRSYPIEKYDPNLWNLRRNLHNEEMRELRNAMFDERTFNLVEIADGICDTIVVVCGTAVSFGIPLDECMQEVHRSNMSKLGEDGLPITRAMDGKILKGPRYSPPDLNSIIYGGVNAR
jgi:predicted HAD superfamily Cof-like phosphohydrolase